MDKYIVALASIAALSACAGTPRGAQTAAAECKMVNSDATDSHIKVKQECTPPADQQGTSKSHQSGTR
jgi:hypothetical protein